MGLPSAPSSPAPELPLKRSHSDEELQALVRAAAAERAPHRRSSSLGDAKSLAKRRSAKFRNSEYLDLDSVKGYTSFYTKPAHDRRLFWVGFSKALTFPLCYGFWRARGISRRRFALGAALYCCHLLACVLYQFTDLFQRHLRCGGNFAMSEKLRIEVWLPVLLLLVSGVAHGRLLAALGYDPSPKKLPKKAASSVLEPRADDSDTESETSFGEEDEDDEGDPIAVDSVNVSVWNDREECSKVAMRVGQLRNILAVKANNVRLRRMSLNMGRIGAIVLALLPLVFHFHYSYVYTSPVPRTTAAPARAEPGCAAGVGAAEGGCAADAPDAAAAAFVAVVTTSPLFPHATTCGVPPLCAGYVPPPAEPLLRRVLTLPDWLWRDGEFRLECAAPTAPGTPVFSLVCQPACFALSCVSLLSVLYIAWPAFQQMAETELTYTRRYMYAKYFKALTSSRRARRLQLPHFSLKNVANIKVWLALRGGRAWLKRHHQQRIADSVAGFTFTLVFGAVFLLLLDFLALGNGDPSKFPSSLLHWELLGWGLVLSWFLLRFMVLGSRINSKYRDTGVLITEQINLQLRILQHISNAAQRGQATASGGKVKESKKEKLQISGNVLKLASELLKSQLDSPHKISGLSMNPFLYNITRIVLLSALSAVLSELCGFNIRLWKLVKG